MIEWTITKNVNADLEYFEAWMNENYSEKYEGHTYSDGWAYIKVFSSTAFTTSEKTTIENYYNSLTTEESGSLKQCCIYSYMDWEEKYSLYLPPIEVDYVRSLDARLNPIITDVYKGEVREITYYETVVLNPDGTQTGETPVIKETFVYTRDTSLLPISRVMKIYWFLQDGTTHETIKERLKHYTPEQKIAEGQRRRRNIIDFMQPPVLGMIAITEGITIDEAITIGAPLFDTYQSEISTYVYSPRNPVLQDAITADTTYAWLNNDIGGGVTIRAYMLDQLNY